MCTFRDLESGLCKTTVASGKMGERSVRRATSGENLVEARGNTDVRTVRYAWTKVRKFN